MPFQIIIYLSKKQWGGDGFMVSHPYIRFSKVILILVFDRYEISFPFQFLMGIGYTLPNLSPPNNFKKYIFFTKKS